jgi:hypothetical protein
MPGLRTTTATGHDGDVLEIFSSPAFSQRVLLAWLAVKVQPSIKGHLVVRARARDAIQKRTAAQQPTATETPPRNRAASSVHAIEPHACGSICARLACRIGCPGGS